MVAGRQDRPAADDLADLSRPEIAAVLADDPQLVERRRNADRVRLALDVVAVEDGDEALGEAVELVQPARQPPDQLLLVLEQERRAEREDHLERRAGAPRRSPGRPSSAMSCDGTSIVCVTRSRGERVDHVARFERRQQDVRAAEVERRHQRDERAVEGERAGVHDDALRVDAERARHAGRVGLADPVRVDDPLRLAGRARAVEDRQRVVLRQTGRRTAKPPTPRRSAPRRSRRRRGSPPGKGRAPPAPAPPRRRSARTQRGPRPPRRANSDGEALCAKERAHRHGDDPCLHRGEVELDGGDAVVQHEADQVARLQPEAEERVRRPVGARVELGVRHPPPAEDEREVVASVAAVARRSATRGSGFPPADDARRPGVAGACREQEHEVAVPQRARPGRPGRARAAGRRRSCGRCRRGTRRGTRRVQARRGARGASTASCGCRRGSRRPPGPRRFARPRRAQQRRSSQGSPGRARASSPPGRQRRGSGSRRSARCSRPRAPSPGARTTRRSGRGSRVARSARRP